MKRKRRRRAIDCDTDGMETFRRRTLLFAPCAFNLAETSRMVEIAKGVAVHPDASRRFEIQFISDGGDFEELIERHGFALRRMAPRLTRAKIEHIAKVDRGEKFAPAFTDAEMAARVGNEIAALAEFDPIAVVTGSYLTIPVSCRVRKTPLVWVIQSTWLPGFFEHRRRRHRSPRRGTCPKDRRQAGPWFHQRLDTLWFPGASQSRRPPFRRGGLSVDLRVLVRRRHFGGGAGGILRCGASARPRLYRAANSARRVLAAGRDFAISRAISRLSTSPWAVRERPRSSRI